MQELQRWWRWTRKAVQINVSLVNSLRSSPAYVQVHHGDGGEGSRSIGEPREKTQKLLHLVATPQKCSLRWWWTSTHHLCRNINGNIYLCVIKLWGSKWKGPAFSFNGCCWDLSPYRRPSGAHMFRAVNVYSDEWVITEQGDCKFLEYYSSHLKNAIYSFCHVRVFLIPRLLTPIWDVLFSWIWLQVLF